MNKYKILCYAAGVGLSLAGAANALTTNTVNTNNSATTTTDTSAGTAYAEIPCPASVTSTGSAGNGFATDSPVTFQHQSSGGQMPPPQPPAPVQKGCKIECKIKAGPPASVEFIATNGNGTTTTSGNITPYNPNQPIVLTLRCMLGAVGCGNNPPAAIQGVDDKTTLAQACGANGQVWEDKDNANPANQKKPYYQK